MMRSTIKPTPVVLDEFARGCLGLTGVRLSRKVEKALCARFQSLPYKDRFDADTVGEQFQTIELAVDAMGRAETQQTIRGNSDLILQASGLIQKLRRMVDLA